jgi:hypothetical protein
MRLALLEMHTQSGVEAMPFPFGISSTVILVEKIVIPSRIKIPWAGLHRPPLLLLLRVMLHGLCPAGYLQGNEKQS